MTDYARDPVAFISRFIKVNELGHPFQLLSHQREILRLAFAFDEDDRLPWDTIVYSCRKKSGKTTINGVVNTWWAFTQEAPNEIKALANDLEQAQSRAFTTIAQLVQRNPDLASSAQVLTKEIRVSNGTIIEALPSEYTGAAGSNHGLTSWDELWAYDSEKDHRLWEELTPVPTRRNSIRFISTYAGFDNESSLLRELYLLGVGSDEHPEGKGERLHPTLPVYGNRAARIFIYWDHEARFPWQTEAYYAAQKRQLRPNAYLRLHENRWTSAESSFISADHYDACVQPTHRPLLPSRSVALFVGVDAGIKSDNAAIAGVIRDGNHVKLAVLRVWHPTPDAPLDLEGTIEATLRELHAQFNLQAIYCDPWQLQNIIQRLEKDRFPICAYHQTVPNQTKAGQLLHDLIVNRNLIAFPNDTLRQHVLNCVAVESARGWRLAKERASRKIDGAVALSMACVAAVDVPVREPLRLVNADTPVDAKEQEKRDQEAEAERKRASAELVQASIKTQGVFWPGEASGPSLDWYRLSQNRQ